MLVLEAERIDRFGGWAGSIELMKSFGLPSLSDGVWALCRWVVISAMPKLCGFLTDGRWLWNRTRTGSPYLAWISGPGNLPSKPQTVVGK